MNSPPTKYTIARWRLQQDNAEAAVITKEQYEELNAVAADNADDFERKVTAAQGKEFENQYRPHLDEAVGFYPDAISNGSLLKGILGGVDDLVNCIPAQSWGEDCLARIVSNDYFSYLGITSEASNN